MKKSSTRSTWNAPPPPKPSTTIILDTDASIEQQAIPILRKMEPVNRIRFFAEALYEAGILKTQWGADWHAFRAQSLALMGGRVLHRMQRKGYACDGLSGWRVESGIKVIDKQTKQGEIDNEQSNKQA